MAKVNSRQTGKVAKLLGELPNESCGLNFYSHETGRKEIVASRMYPALNHPQAINFFFFVCLCINMVFGTATKTAIESRYSAA